MNHRSIKAHNHDAEFEAVNNSGTFIFLVAIVSVVIAVPLAVFF